MKHARKLTSLLLALVMVFALAVTVAADGTTEPVKGSITVDNPVDGLTYTAYKIFDVTHDGDNYSYTIDDTSPWIGTVRAYAIPGHGLTLTLVADTTPATYVVTFDDTNPTNKFSAPSFAATLKNALATVNPTTDVYQLQEQSGKQVASDLPLGYYFVKSSANDALCNLTTTNPDITIHDKNDMPFEKEVDKPSADVGQDVTFTITGQVPDCTGFTKYTYKITDKMTDGLTFNRDSLTVKVGETTVTTDCIVIYDPATDSQTFTVSIPVFEKKYEFGKKIEVTYTATLNEKAVAVVSTNEAKLTYSNDPTTDETKESQPQKKEVYSAKIVIDKFETDNENKKLDGAKFVLYKKAPTATDPNAIQYYKKWDATDTTKAVTWVDSITKATEVTTGNDGAAYFEGLADGTYYLVETKAPAGYNQLTGPKEVKVAGSTTETTKLTVTEKVANQAGTLLPSTGGMGTTIFYVLGAVLVVGAGVLLVTKKRMSQSDI